MFKDGICRIGSDYYTKTIQFQDINYQLAQQEDQTEIFEEWCSFLNFFDSSVHFELSFMNMATDAEKFEKSIAMGNLYGAMSFLSITASDISDRMLADFLGMESSQIVTMHVQSVDQTEAIKTVKHIKISPTGSVEGYQTFFEAIKAASPVPIGFEDIKSGAKGYFHVEDNRIAINNGMSEIQTVKTAIHEMAHNLQVLFSDRWNY